MIRTPWISSEEVDLRRPRIPKAPELPKIIGPRGGPAYLPNPRDQRREPATPSAQAVPVAPASSGAARSVSLGPESESRPTVSERFFGDWLGNF